MKNFSAEVKIVPILSYASGTADRTSSVIDMLGFDSVCIAIHTAAVAAGAVVDYRLQEANAASANGTLTSGADLLGSSQTVADDSDNTVKFIDIVKPLKRFLQLVVNNDAANATAQSAIAYLYNSHSTVPVTHGTGTATVSGGSAAAVGEMHVSPLAGTA
jgi:hypothetical protein